MSDRTNQKIVVTGAASGIGLATAARLRREGAAVFTVDRAGGIDLEIDVTTPGASETIVAAALAKIGRIDGLVPCAGICEYMPIEGHDDAFWERMMAVNVTAVFRMVRAALPALRQSGHCRIVLIGSVMSHFGSAGLVAYTASKHAVLGMTRAMATELGPHGITVNCVQPGAIQTPMTVGFLGNGETEMAQYWRNKSALGRLGQPEDVADVIVFLLSDDARFVSGHGVFVDGATMQQP